MPESRHSGKQQGHAGGRLRGVLALVLLGIVAAVCFSLGQWQLGRAAERDALRAALEHGRSQPPLVLSAATDTSAFVPWQAAGATGRWSDEHTVLLQNRNLDGVPGYWVATPLLLTPQKPPVNRNDVVAAGSAELQAMSGEAGARDFFSRGASAQQPAVLVLRGWLPRDFSAVDHPPSVPQEPGLVQVTGELHTHIPRLFELWKWAGGAASQLPAAIPQASGAIAQVQNLELSEYERATGLDLLPVVLAQTQATQILQADGLQDGTPNPGQLSEVTPSRGTQAPPSGTALRREWPGPSLDADQNRGYALQWFSFCAIAVIAGLFVLRSMLRQRANPSSKEAS